MKKKHEKIKKWPLSFVLNEQIDKKGNTLSYKIGDGNWTEYTEPFTVQENCQIQAGLYNCQTTGTTASLEISNIDHTAPTDVSFTVGEKLEESIKITATATDDSEIAYFQYSTDGGTNWSENQEPTPTSTASKEIEITNLTAGTTYVIKVLASPANSEGALTYSTSGANLSNMTTGVGRVVAFRPLVAISK